MIKNFKVDWRLTFICFSVLLGTFLGTFFYNVVFSTNVEQRLSRLEDGEAFTLEIIIFLLKDKIKDLNKEVDLPYLFMPDDLYKMKSDPNNFYWGCEKKNEY